MSGKNSPSPCFIFNLSSASYLTFRVSLRAPLPISRAAPLLILHSSSHFTLRFSFYSSLDMSRSASHFTLLFSFYSPLLISGSAPPLILHSASHFTLHFSLHPPLLKSCHSHYLNNGTGLTPFRGNILSSNFEGCSVFCSVLQKYLGEPFWCTFSISINVSLEVFVNELVDSRFAMSVHGKLIKKR